MQEPNDYSILDMNQARIREAHAERACVDSVMGVSFKDCAHLNSVTDEIEVNDHKGAIIKIRVQDVYKRWSSFLDQAILDMSKGRLDGVAPQLAIKFANWIRTQKRYCLITSEQDCEWLAKVAQLVVTRRIMEFKYHNREVAFADDFARQKMSFVLMIRDVMGYVARVAHHGAAGNSDSRNFALNEILATFNRCLEAARLDCQPLPPLPAQDAKLLMPAGDDNE